MTKRGCDVWLLTIVTLLVFSVSSSPSSEHSSRERFFNVYTDKDTPSNHFYPTGWIGDWGDVLFDDDCRLDPFGGRACIKVTYSAKNSKMWGWGGIYWLYPEDNWGDLPGGFNLTGVISLSFWAKGAIGGEQVEFKVGGITGLYGDSLQSAVSTGVVNLTSDWQQVNIDLYGKNVNRVVGGFCWISNKTLNPNGATFYLDDIVYEFGYADGDVSITQPVDSQELKAGLQYTVTLRVRNTGNLPISEFNASLISSSGIVLFENSKILVLDHGATEYVSFEIKPEGIGNQTVKVTLSCGDERLAEHEIQVCIVEPSLTDLLYRNSVVILIAIILAIAIVMASVLLKKRQG